MKKIIVYALIVLVILSGLNLLNYRTSIIDNMISSFNEDDALTINSPKVPLVIQGQWDLEESISTNQDITSRKDEGSIFISPAIIEYNTSIITNPNFSSKYVKLSSYLNVKVSNVPEAFDINQEYVDVYKAQDNNVMSQEFMLVDSGKLVVIDTNSIDIYKKTRDVSDQEGSQKYTEYLKNLSSNESSTRDSSFAFSASFRVNNPNTSSKLRYKYITYFFSKLEGDRNVNAMATDNIVFFRDQSLWTVKQELNTSGQTERIVTSVGLVGSEDENLNFISDTFLRRIDYVNDNYIAFTNIRGNSAGYSEKYSIMDLFQLSLNQPLTVINIAGESGVETYTSRFIANNNEIEDSNLSENINTNPDYTNIGIYRNPLQWKFISNVETLPSDSSIGGIRRTFDLDIMPIIDIAKTYNESMNWNYIRNRVPSAVTASASTNNNYVFIQAESELKVYPLYNSNLFITPFLEIPNTENQTLVSIKWYKNENFEIIKNEFEKLNKINITVIKPE